LREWRGVYCLCFDAAGDYGAIEGGDRAGCVDDAFGCPGPACCDGVVRSRNCQGRWNVTYTGWALGSPGK
jgi:hypothetical protein